MSPYGGGLSPYGMGSLGSFQMQQMMMQEQMAQYQQMMSYYNAQQQQQQNAMAQYRLISSLQAEMQTLEIRLQQAYLGIGVGGMMGGSSGMLTTAPSFLAPGMSTAPTGYGR